MKALKILTIMALAVILAGLIFNQWLLHRQWLALAHAPVQPPGVDAGASADAARERLRQAEEQLNEARTQLQLAGQRLASAQAQVAQMDQRLRQLESGRRPRMPGGLVSQDTVEVESGLDIATRATKRSWGPEQAVGAPDTHQAGDIPTAWASREPDGGEEWLKLDYENPVDVAEVRVRETHNPGAISKVTAFTANGTEITLWEGTEPPSQAPVEMSFQVPNSVNAKSIKVYLDTKRVPGWNEIDAVELVGRDGSHQWAKQANASSTYAEPRVVKETGGLLRL
jgi:hypothetical protein